LYDITKPAGSDKQYLSDKIRFDLSYFGKKFLKLNYIDVAKHTYVYLKTNGYRYKTG